MDTLGHSEKDSETSWKRQYLAPLFCFQHVVERYLRGKLEEQIMSATYVVREVVSVHSNNIGMSKLLKHLNFDAERLFVEFPLLVINTKSHRLYSKAFLYCVILEPKELSTGTDAKRHLTTKRKFKIFGRKLHWFGIVVHNHFLYVGTINRDLSARRGSHGQLCLTYLPLLMQWLQSNGRGI